MNLNNANIKIAPFPEYVTVTSSQSVNPLFDIIIDENVTLENYCKVLLNKVFEIPQSKFQAFINYQTDIIQDELRWLNKFEKLISLNEELFITSTCLSRFNKMYHCIDKKREEVQSLRVSAVKKATPKRLINAEAEDRHFSFHEVKDHIEKINDFNEKLIYLTEEIFEYKQAEIISKNSKLMDYDYQCTQLIEKLQTIRKMKSEFEKEKELTENNPGSSAAQHLKLQINGPINILTNAFKQMMVNVKPNGTPYIQYKIKDVAQFICDNFVDENGQPISQATIQTYLSPN
ncbi:MAG: hypothetical protein O9262_02285, partial [Cyclobacteriaceae bacterium]|nr:hypothetical protein [Cyclobacteriaceae bacterium]